MRSDEGFLAKHWTRIGVFEITDVYLAGTRCYRLYIDETLLGNYFEWADAVKSISLGERDAKLAEPGRSLNVPAHWGDWNDLR